MRATDGVARRPAEGGGYPSGPALGSRARRLRRAVTVASLRRPVAGEDLERVTGFVDGRIESMPAHLRLGVEAVEILLAFRATARTGRSPARLGEDALISLVGAWERSRLGPVRQYVRLVRSLAVFALYDQRFGESP